MSTPTPEPDDLTPDEPALEQVSWEDYAALMAEIASMPITPETGH